MKENYPSPTCVHAFVSVCVGVVVFLVFWLSTILEGNQTRRLCLFSGAFGCMCAFVYVGNDERTVNLVKNWWKIGARSVVPVLLLCSFR